MTLIKLADDLFVPEDFEKNHWYFADEEGKKKYTGVSTILDTVYGKPWLLKWAANCAVDFIKEGGDVEEARLAYTIKKKDAADFGTDAHEEVEKIVKEGIEHNQGFLPIRDYTKESPQIQNFAKWADENNVKFLASELRLHDTEMWVAGTTDFVCEIEGKTLIGDLKTSKQLSYDYILQCAAYAIMYKKPIDGVILVRCGKGGKVYDKKTKKYSEVDPKDDFEVIARYAIEEDKQAFLSALNLYRARASFGE